MVKVVTNNLEASHNETEAKDLNIININFRIINFREAHSNRTILNMATTTNPTFREIKQIATEAEAVARIISNLEDMVVVGPIIRVAMECINISITCMTHRRNSMAHLVVYAVVLIIPVIKHCYKGEHDINNIMEKISINPHQQQQSNLYQ